MVGANHVSQSHVSTIASSSCAGGGPSRQAAPCYDTNVNINQNTKAAPSTGLQPFYESLKPLVHSPAGFLGVWSAPNVTAYIPNALRYLTTAPTPGVLYTSINYSPPAYFEGKLMQVRLMKRIEFDTFSSHFSASQQPGAQAMCVEGTARLPFVAVRQNTAAR